MMKRPREDPSSPELLALGYASTLFDDPLLSAKQQAALLQTHPHDAELTLDRYDVRLLLDGAELTHAAAPSASASASTAKVEAEGGAEVEAERWVALAEAEALEGAQREAEAARQREAEETERRLKQAREVPPLLRRVVDFVCAQPAHERELVEQALRDSPGGAVRFGFLFAGQPQHAFYTALRDGTPLPPIKAKEEIQAERRQRAKMLAAQLML